MLSREWRIWLGPGGVVLFVKLTEFCGAVHRDADCMTEEGVESLDPKHLTREHRAEVAGDGYGDGVQVERPAEFLLHRRDRLRGDAAGDDQIEEAEVGVYVEGEAVGCDEAGDVDAYGSDFGLGCIAGLARFASLDSRGGCAHMCIGSVGIRPDARQSRDSLCGDCEIGARAD